MKTMMTLNMIVILILFAVFIISHDILTIAQQLNIPEDLAAELYVRNLREQLDNWIDRIRRKK